MRRAIALATAEAAEEAFYDAMQRGDAAGMMALWADDEEVDCIHPGGKRLVGLKAIRDSFETIFSAGGIDVRPSDVRVHQSATVAVHTLVEKVVVATKGVTRIVECLATNVYVKGAAGWRIVLHHASPAGESTRQPVAVTAPPSTLH